MSVITVIWSMTAAASLTLGVVYLFIWMDHRRDLARLWFATMAWSVAAFAGFELVMMHASSPSRLALAARWIHVATWVMVVSIVWFTRAYLRAGRPWLGWTVVGLRTLALLVNFAVDGSITFREVTGIKQGQFLGEPVSIPVAVPNPWMLLAHGSVLLLLAFLIDASVSVWRRGERRSALLVGGSLVLFSAQALLQVVLVLWGLVAAPLRVSAGFLVILIVMAFEISRTIRSGTRASRQLHEAEQRASLTVHVADIGFWSWRVVHDELWASDRARVHLGLAHDAPLRMQGFFDAMHADDRDSVRRAIARARFDGGEHEAEYRIPGADGRVQWIAMRVSSEHAKTDGVIVRGVTMNVTERHRAEAKFLVTIEASPHAVLLVDRAGSIVLANGRAAELFGHAKGELVGLSVDVLVPPEDRAAHPADRERFFASPTARAMGAGREMQARRKDGTEVPVEIGLNPIESEQGPLVLCSIIDISPRRQAEAEIAQLRENLSHAGRVSTMGQLASALAHEINQPLGAILRNAEAAELVLQRDPPDLDELRDIVSDIHRDDQRAGEVIDRIGSLLKHFPVEMLPLSVASVVRDAVAVIRAHAAGRNVRIAIDVPPDELQVLGDRVQVQQVILNLVVNGIQAATDQTPDRRIVRITAGQDGPGMARVSVVDRGCGISPDQVSRIFEPFFTTKPDGMGMGLAISRTIVEAHGGRIWMEDTPGGGATVHFTLRIADRGSQA